MRNLCQKAEHQLFDRGAIPWQNPAETKKTLTPATGIVTGGVVTLETTTPPCSDRMPEYEAIALLAYSYYEGRGYQGGSPEEDWFRAEQQLKTDKKNSTE
jgi:hypothetical protein